jgi:hypothetical protein|tara:strand:- start:290 stop:727 length:438 start_codon:yes stop_codon:yes gene_type:complete
MAWKGKRKGKSMIKSKKASYNGIEFQSLLEKRMYQLLHEEEIPVEYEEHSFTVFDALVYPQACYEGTPKKLYNKGSKVRSITYTPDFVDPNGKWIIETKGYANESFPLRWKLFKRHLKENNLAYVLFMPRNKTQCLEVLELIKQL